MNGAFGGRQGVKPTTTKRPGKASLAMAMIISCVLTSLAAVSLHVRELLIAGLCFVAASAVLSFLLLFFRSFTVCIVPVVSVTVAVSSGASVFLASAVACAVTVFAAMYAICHMKRCDSFRQFMWCTVAYSLLYGMLFCFVLLLVYRSISSGIMTLGEQLASLSDELLTFIKEYGIETEEIEPYIETGMKMSVLFIPAFICISGVVSAWCMRGFFSLYTRACGIGTLFDGRQTSAPKSFAVAFVVLSIFGAFFGFLSMGALLSLSNILSVLTVIFLGEGIRHFLASFSGRPSARPKPTLLIAVIALMFFMPGMVFMILPYYGAFSVITTKKRKTADQ